MFSRRTRSKLSFDSFFIYTFYLFGFCLFFFIHSFPIHPPSLSSIPYLWDSSPPTVQTIVDYFRIRISSFDRVIFANSIGFVT